MIERGWEEMSGEDALAYVQMHGPVDLVIDGTEYRVTDAWIEHTWSAEDGRQVAAVALWQGRDYELVLPGQTVRICS